MTRSQAIATQLIDDERVCVTRFDLAAGAETVWHVHGMDYVITTVTECKMTLEEPDGKTRRVVIPAGTAYRRDKGVEHNVVNGGKTDMAFIEIELK